MPAGDQLTLDLGEVVDLAVRDDLNRAVLVAERLLAAGEIHDRQPAHGERDSWQPHAPLLVRSAMVQCPHHPLDLARRHRPLEIPLDNPDNPAHTVQPAVAAPPRRSRTTRAGTPAAI